MIKEEIFEVFGTLYQGKINKNNNFIFNIKQSEPKVNGVSLKC